MHGTRSQQCCTREHESVKNDCDAIYFSYVRPLVVLSTGPFDMDHAYLFHLLAKYCAHRRRNRRRFTAASHVRSHGQCLAPEQCTLAVGSGDCSTSNQRQKKSKQSSVRSYTSHATATLIFTFYHGQRYQQGRSQQGGSQTSQHLLQTKCPPSQSCRHTKGRPQFARPRRCSA